MAENNKGESRGEMQAARIKAWEKGAHRFINHGQPTPHTAWINGFNTGFADGYTAAQTDAARSPDSVCKYDHAAISEELGVLRHSNQEDGYTIARLTRQLATAREFAVMLASNECMYSPDAGWSMKPISDFGKHLLEILDKPEGEPNAQ